MDSEGVQDGEVLKDTIEQSRCRERTEEEDRAVEASFWARVLIRAGAGEIRLG